MSAIGRNEPELLLAFYFATIIGADADKARSYRQVMYLFAGHFAGVAADAVFGIDFKRIFVRHWLFSLTG
jgi:hypothetical protein